jgi:uncharacterized protein
MGAGHRELEKPVRSFAKFCALLVVLGLFVGVPAAGQDEATAPPIVLVPHVDETFALESMVPSGWTDVGGGAFVDENDPRGVNMILLQSGPLNQDGTLAGLLPLLGLSETPHSVGTHSGVAFEWTLYKLELDGEPTLDLALAQSGSTTYVVVLQASPADYVMLHANVFLPALNSLVAHVELDQAPVPYTVEEVTYPSGGMVLAGTLTLPPTDGRHPVVVLVSGSGPQDRDETFGGGIAIKSFKLLADALTRQGIAVLRYDERGIGQSGGDFASATTSDFADDAEAGIAYLLTREDIDPNQIGLLGHSEGGLVAAMLGARNADLDFIVLLAGPAVSGFDVLRLQVQLGALAEGVAPEQAAAKGEYIDGIFAHLDDPQALEDFAYEQAKQQLAAMPESDRAGLGDLDAVARAKGAETAAYFGTDWYKMFLRYDPGPDLAQTHIPVLAIFGGKDTQVDAGQNAPALVKALTKAGNKDYAISVLPGANHLFQQAGTGAASEYPTLPGEFTPDLLPVLLAWLHEHVAIVE